MNRKSFIGKSLAKVAAMFLLMLFFTGCGKKTDIVEGVKPVRSVTEKQRATLESLKGKSPKEIGIIIKEEWPDLGTRLIANLRSDGKIKPSEKVSNPIFFYGSSDAKGESGDGKRYIGQFRDQLIAKINVAGRKDPIYLAVLCSNGLYELTNSRLEATGSMGSRFVIQKGKNLVAYIGYESAVHLAARNKLPIVMGRGAHSKRIGLREALRTDTDRHLVRVSVYPGDVVDLADMSFRRAR